MEGLFEDEVLPPTEMEPAISECGAPSLTQNETQLGSDCPTKVLADAEISSVSLIPDDRLEHEQRPESNNAGPLDPSVRITGYDLRSHQAADIATASDDNQIMTQNSKSSECNTPFKVADSEVRHKRGKLQGTKSTKPTASKKIQSSPDARSSTPSVIIASKISIISQPNEQPVTRGDALQKRYDALEEEHRKESQKLQRQGKEVRRLKLRLEEKQQRLLSTRNDLKNTKRNLEKAMRRLDDSQTPKRKNGNLGSELKIARADLQKYQRQIEQLQISKSSTQELRRTLELTQHELTMCKDELFRFRPRTQVPDSCIRYDFDQLFRAVTDWINEEVALSETQSARVDISELCAVDSGTNAGGFLKSYPRATRLFVRYLVNSELARHIFSEEIYLDGIEPRLADDLRETEDVIAKQDLTTGLSESASWRSRTLSATVDRPAYKASLDHRVTAMTTIICDSLTNTMPMLFSNADSRRRLAVKVIKPAMRLAIVLQTAVSKFRIYTPLDPFKQFTTVRKDNLTRLTLVDHKTRMTIGSMSTSVADREDQIADLLLPLEPSINRRDRNQGWVYIRNGVWLAELGEPHAKRQRMS